MERGLLMSFIMDFFLSPEWPTLAVFLFYISVCCSYPMSMRSSSCKSHPGNFWLDLEISQWTFILSADLNTMDMNLKLFGIFSHQWDWLTSLSFLIVVTTNHTNPRFQGKCCWQQEICRAMLLWKFWPRNNVSTGCVCTSNWQESEVKSSSNDNLHQRQF